MQLDRIKDVCSGLMYKAKAEKFLEHSINDIEVKVNFFVEEFAKENGLEVHFLPAYKWYFQSDSHLVEDGLVELHCKTNFLEHEGACIFEIVNNAEIDKTTLQLQ
jgi:hypothetical protein